MANGPPEEGAYQCFFNRDDLPSPMEGGTLCDFPLAQLSGFPDHEEHFPLYTGARLEDMVESIRRHGVQSPILVWKTAEGTYIIISGHNRVNASKIAGLTTIPAVIRTDLTQETAEDLFYEMNFRQRSLADMLFSQRVLCIAAHYNMLKRQGRRTDLQTFETTSPDTQEKSHTDVKIAQEYELTRDKVSKYCRYATLYRPLLLLMNSGKRLGQLAAYEISFVEDHSLQECIYQFISEGSASISTAKGKKLRAAFEDGKLDASQIKSILSGGGKEKFRARLRALACTNHSDGGEFTRHALNERLDSSSRSLGAEKPRFNHAGIVGNEEIAGAKEFFDIPKSTVFNDLFGNMKQPRSGAICQRILGNEFRRKLEIEI